MMVLRSKIASRGARFLAVVVCLFIFSLSSGCKKKAEVAAEPSSQSAELSRNFGIRTEDLLRVLPGDAVAVAIWDTRELLSLVVESMSTGAPRGVLRARLGFALDEYGQNTELIQYFGRPLLLSTLTMVGWSRVASGDQLVVMDAAVFPEFPEDYGPLPLREGGRDHIAIRGRLAIVGAPELVAGAVARRVSPEADSAATVSLADVLETGGLSEMARASLQSSKGDGVWFHAWASEGIALPSFAPQTSSFGRFVEAGEWTIRVNARGGVRVGLRGNTSAMHHVLVKAYESAAESLEGVVNPVPTGLSAWTNYLNLVVNGAWSRLEFRVEASDAGEIGWFELKDVACGSMMRNALIGSALWSSIDAAAKAALVLENPDPGKNDEAGASSPEAVATGSDPSQVAAESTEESVEDVASAPAEPRVYSERFSNISVELASSCGSFSGMIPRLPRSMARVGGDSDAGGVLLVADYGALLRSALPSAFEMLPFAFSEASLREVFGEAPMGLASWRDENAQVVFYMEATPGSDRQLYARVPSALQTALPVPLTPGEGGMSTVGSPALEARLASDTRQGWMPVMDSIRQDAMAIVIVNRLILEGVADIAEERSPTLFQALKEVEYLSLVMSADFSLELVIRMRAGNDADAFATRFQASLSKAAQEMMSSGDVASSTGLSLGVQRRLLDALSSQVQLEARSPQVVVVNFGGLGKAASVGLVGMGFFAALTPQKIYAEGGQIRGPLYPTIRSMEVVPATP